MSKSTNSYLLIGLIGCPEFCPAKKVKVECIHCCGSCAGVCNTCIGELKKKKEKKEKKKKKRDLV